MSLYCLKHKSANKKCKCDPRDLVSVTDNMIPVLLQAESLGLKVASAFCLTEIHKESTSVEASVFFKYTYPEELLQDLTNGWYWTDYITVEKKVLCSCLSQESEYINNDDVSLEEYVEGVINSLVRYLETRNKDGLRAVLTLLQS